MRRPAFSTALLFSATAVLSLTAWAGIRSPEIKVDFNHPVHVDSQVLPPGHYEFKGVDIHAGPLAFQVITPQGQILTLTGVPTSAVYGHTSSTYNTPSQSRVVLKKVGNQYYLDKIWIAGHKRGWQFNIPASAKSQAGQAENVPAQNTGEAEPH